MAIGTDEGLLCSLLGFPWDFILAAPLARGVVQLTDTTVISLPPDATCESGCAHEYQFPGLTGTKTDI